MPRTQTGSPRKRPKPAKDGGVVAEFAVAGESLEIGEQRVDVIDRVRTLRMPRDLRLLPRRQIGIEVFQGLYRLGLDAADLLGHRAGLAFRLHGAQLVGFGVELGNCFFKIEITAHEAKNRAGSRVSAALAASGGNWPAAAFKSSKPVLLGSPLLIGQRMQVADQAFQPLFQHMGVDLRR